MTAPSFTRATWFTSSYSAGNGGNCVEVAFANWQTSSYSGSNGGECVEVAFTEPMVGVRDSKHRAAGHLTVPTQAWQYFLAIATGPADS